MRKTEILESSLHIIFLTAMMMIMLRTEEKEKEKDDDEEEEKEENVNLNGDDDDFANFASLWEVEGSQASRHFRPQ